MKYLKSYDKQNINEKLISKEELDNMINKSLISDLKELSYDLIDEGKTLYIQVYDSREENLCLIIFNHTKDEIRYSNYNIHSGVFEAVGDIFYEFYYRKSCISGSLIYVNKSVIEIEERIQAMYPNEKVISL